MSDRLEEYQVHFAYALWIGLVIALVTLAMGYRIDSVFRQDGVTELGGGGLSVISIAFPLGLYCLFRLVRPFPFNVTGSNPPDNFFYWIGSFLVTLGIAAAVFFLAWGVSVSAQLLQSYRNACLVSPWVTVAGFAFVEASYVRRGWIYMKKPPYLDAGLLSSVVILPILLLWFVTVSPRAGFGQLINKAFMSDTGSWLVPVSMFAGIFLFWWATIPIRRRFRRSNLYQASTGALWVFAIAELVGMVILPRVAPGMVGFIYQSAFIYFLLVACFWVAVTVGMYVVKRKRVSQ